MAPIVDKLPLPRLLLGEGPHWKVENESLYLVDIEGKTIYRYHPRSGKYYSVKLDFKIGFIVPVEFEDDKFVIGGGTSLYIVKWDGVSDKADSLELLLTLDEPDTNRINDGKCDPTGRLWFGTMSMNDPFAERKGALYSYTKKEGLKKHFTDIGISNGLAWDVKRNTMYYIDSNNQAIDVIDYKSNGEVANRRTTFSLKENGMEFYPDGTTIDLDGKLWTACFFGSRVINVDPELKKVLGHIDIPTNCVTSAAWGGSDLSELYVTTAGFNVEINTQLGDDPNGGLTYRITGLKGSRGLPMTSFKLN